MKIAIVGTRGIPNNYGGYEQLAEYLSIGLAKNGHDVTVYNNSLHRYKKKIYKGVNIRKIYSPENFLGSSANLFYDYFSLWDAIFKRNDIILECGYQSSAIGLYFAPIFMTKIVTNMDGLDWKRSKWSPWVQKLTKFFERLAVNKSHALIADNLGIQEYLKNEYDVDSHFIAYGTSIPINFEIKVLNKYNITKNNYFILVARLEPENSIEIILDGYLKSKEKKPFIVVGNLNTKYSKYLLKKYINSDNIKFIGGVYNQNDLNSLRHFSFMYFHGHTVGGTNPSLLDAMACYCLIVAHDNNFNKSVLKSNGFYFGNSEEVCNVILNENICSSKDNFVKKNIKTVNLEYSWERIIEQHEELFFKILN